MMAHDDLKNASLLVLANKQDIPGALTVPQLTDALGLTSMRGRKWFIQGTCAVTGDGLYEGLDWLSKNVDTAK